MFQQEVINAMIPAFHKRVQHVYRASPRSTSLQCTPANTPSTVGTATALPQSTPDVRDSRGGAVLTTAVPSSRESEGGRTVNSRAACEDTSGKARRPSPLEKSLSIW